MTPMKRMSCSGCEKCEWLAEDLKEQMGILGFSPIMDNLEDCGLYRLTVDNISRDWESGIIDDWDIVFRKVKENETC